MNLFSERSPLTPQARSRLLWAFVIGVNVLGAILMYIVLLRLNCIQAAYFAVVPGSFRYAIDWLNVPWCPLGNIPTSLIQPVSRRIVNTTVPISTSDVETAVVVAAIATCLVSAPFIGFLRHGWFARYYEFRNSLKDGALYAYLRRFWSSRLLEGVRFLRNSKWKPGDSADSGTDPEEQLHDDPGGWTSLERDCLAVGGEVFKRIYHEQYGFRPFVPPFLLLLIVTYIDAVALAFINPCAAKLQVCSGYFFGSEPILIISALSGAYFFSVSDAVMSIRRRALNVTDVYWYALRTFLAIPIAIFFASRTSGSAQGWSPVLAFSIATLPVDVLVKQIRRFGYTFLGLSTNSADEEGDQLLTLSGMTSPIVVQFLAEGVYSVEQIATTDPVLLAIRTGLPFRLVLRFGSQAIVRRHLGDAAQKLISVGLCDAVSIYYMLLRSAAADIDSMSNVIKSTLQKQPVASGNQSSASADASTVTVDLIKAKLPQIAGEEYTNMLVHICPLAQWPPSESRLSAPKADPGNGNLDTTPRSSAAPIPTPVSKRLIRGPFYR